MARRDPFAEAVGQVGVGVGGQALEGHQHGSALERCDGERDIQQGRIEPGRPSQDVGGSRRVRAASPVDVLQEGSPFVAVEHGEQAHQQPVAPGAFVKDLDDQMIGDGIGP